MFVCATDGHSLGHRAEGSGQGLEAGDLPTTAINFSIRHARELILKGDVGRVIWLWDGPKSWRKDMYPEYKAQRGSDPASVQRRKNFKAQRPVIMRALKMLSIDQAYSETSEADDLAGWYAFCLPRNGEQVLLETSDKDWLQLVSEDVVWHSSQHKLTVGNANFGTETGCVSARQFVERKALTGDASDNIKGVGGIGAKGADDLLSTFGSVPNFISAYRAGGMGSVPAAWRRLAENQPNKHGLPTFDVFRRNVALMRLVRTAPPDDLQEFPGEGVALDHFRELCHECNFQSILNEFDQWVEPFVEYAKKHTNQ